MHANHASRPMYARCTLLIAVVALALSASGSATSYAAPSRPSRNPVATPTPVADPVPALSSCASTIFGLDLNYTQAGGLTQQIARTLNLTTPSGDSINASISGTATALYGLTDNAGVEALVYGDGSSDTLTIDTASLCSLQFSSAAAPPASADDALSLLKATFPGVPQYAPYAATTTRNGYCFYLATARPTDDGATTAQAIVLTAVTDPDRGLIVGALSGTGTYAGSVAAP